MEVREAKEAEAEAEDDLIAVEVSVNKEREGVNSQTAVEGVEDEVGSEETY